MNGVARSALVRVSSGRFWWVVAGHAGRARCLVEFCQGGEATGSIIFFFDLFSRNFSKVLRALLTQSLHPFLLRTTCSPNRTALLLSLRII